MVTAAVGVRMSEAPALSPRETVMTSVAAYFCRHPLHGNYWSVLEALTMDNNVHKEGRRLP